MIRTKRAWIAAIVSLCVGAAQAQTKQQTTAPETLESLRERLSAHITQPRFAASSWGIKVVSLDTGKTVFEHEPQKYFNPASNAKLYTAALALEYLGADYRIKTSLYSTARPDASGALRADLVVYGRGDPTMAARLNGGDYFKALDPLVAKLQEAGVRRIEGDIVGDESYFVGPPLGSGWEWDDLQAYYGAETSALTINDNALDLFVKPADRVGIPCRITTGPSTSLVTIMNRTQTAAKGTESRIVVYRPVGENIVYVSGRLAIDNSGYNGSVSIHNPAGLFATLLKDALIKRGIVVTGRTRVVDWKYREVTPVDFTKLIELGSVESMPLGDIVRETLKPSQNLYAQLLLLQVGERVRSGGLYDREPGAEAVTTKGSASVPSLLDKPFDSHSTSEELAFERLNDFLSRAVGVKKGDVLLEEGSGLSRRDVITPQATVNLLSYVSSSRYAAVYRNALPIAGVDGTLQNRMKGTAAAGNVRAKTGTLRYVYALSGYVTTAAGERLAFSIMLNNYHAERSDASSGQPQRLPAPRDDLDAIAITLASFTGRTQQ
jgi:D-alanyl-D-alanine carboxypeptidase/D-alanyl-D-alanine-endopeptidase (penicillin-binding protein 4)